MFTVILQTREYDRYYKCFMTSTDTIVGTYTDLVTACRTADRMRERLKEFPILSVVYVSDAAKETYYCTKHDC
jgi:hypothetical protein